MKRVLVLAALVTSASAFAAVTVRYHNGDSKKHTFSAVCSGSKSQLVTDGNTTGSATIQGSGPCKVTHAGGEVSLKGGENIDIKDGKISVK
ncbi:MAG: hypothetical protein AMXMBFR34_27430 [Myxococcaceae bacterium]